MANKYYENDIGTEIIVDCGEDISLATGTTLEVQKPGGEAVSWVASIYQTNYLKYTTIAGDFIPGIYKLNAKLTLGAWTGHGETATFTVYERFE